MLVVRLECRTAGQPVEGHQEPLRALPEAKRRDQRGCGPLGELPEAVAHSAAQVGDALGRPPGERRRRNRPGAGHGQAHHVPRGLARGGGHPRLPVALEHHHERAGPEEGAPALHHQFEHPLEVRLGAHRVGDRGRGLEPAHRSFELGVPALKAGVEARVVDGDRGPSGQDHRRLQVALVEVLAALLVGEVQVAVDLVADPDGHARGRSSSAGARAGSRRSGDAPSRHAGGAARDGG